MSRSSIAESYDVHVAGGRSEIGLYSKEVREVTERSTNRPAIIDALAAKRLFGLSNGIFLSIDIMTSI